MLLLLPRYSGGFCFLVPPPAGYFPAMESNQRSPGLRARTQGSGGGGGDTGSASPLAVTRRFSLRPNTSAIGPSGGYPPCKTCEQLPCLWLYSCRLSDCHLRQDSLGVEAAGVFFLAFRAFLAFNTFRAFRKLLSVQRTFKAFSFTQSSTEMWKTSEKIFHTDSTQNYLVEDGSPKGGMSTAPPTKLLPSLSRGISARGANGRSIEGGG